MALKSPVPTKMYTKLKYVEFVQLNPGAAGAVATHVFSANGMYDPDITGSGHQPRGFDQLMALYDHYAVKFCKCTCTFVPNGLGQPAMCGIAVRDSSSTESSIDYYLETGYVKYKPVSSTEGYETKITYFLDVPKFLGRRNLLSDPELKGSTAANPTENAQFHIFAAPFDTSDVGTIDVYVELEYTTWLIEPKNPGQS